MKITFQQRLDHINDSATIAVRERSRAGSPYGRTTVRRLVETAILAHVKHWDGFDDMDLKAVY